MTITVDMQQLRLKMYFHGHITQPIFGVVNNYTIHFSNSKFHGSNIILAIFVQHNLLSLIGICNLEYADSKLIVCFLQSGSLKQ